MAQNVSEGQISVGDGLYVQRLEKKERTRVVLFMRIGIAGKNKSGQEGINMPLIFANLSRAATWLFWKLEQKRNLRTNIAEFKSADMTTTEQQRTSKGYKELHTLGVIKRTKQNHYLINPRALLPRENKDFNAVMNIWEQTK